MTAVVNIKHVQRDFARAAANYDAYAELQCEVLSHGVRMLMPFLQENAVLLDAGCGTGRAKELIPTGGIMGIDIAIPMCARAFARGMPVAAADICHLPFAGTSIDAALCSLAMQWIPERSSAFAEFFRVMRPGGHVMISTFGEQTLQELRRVLSSRVHAFPALAELIAEAEAVGWQAVSRDSHSYTHYHDSLAALMRPLKAIGAVNKLPGRARGLTTAATFRHAEAQYLRYYGGESGLRATWEVHYLLLQKP